MSDWRVGSYGSGKRHFFVWRKLGDRPQQQLETKAGRIRWFGSYEAAQRAAAAATGPARTRHS